MHEDDKAIIVERYERRLSEFGPVPKALGWPKGRQCFRFEFLSQIDGLQNGDSILDVGCAFGDLHAFLERRGWRGEYLGIDIVPGLIEQGRTRYPELDLRLMDLQNEQPTRTFDWVLCSGALTSKTSGDSYDHFTEMLKIMFGLCEKGVACNFASPYVSYINEIHFHPEIGRLADIINAITRRFTLRHDYMPYEFAAYLYRNDCITGDVNIFDAHRELYEQTKAAGETPK